MGTQATKDAEQTAQNIRERRPLYGDQCSDMGFVETVIEYGGDRPLAVIQYRSMTENDDNVPRDALDALIQLADGYQPQPVPAFLAWYDPEIWRFSLQPLNKAAREYLGRRLIILTERQFFWKLRELRGRESGYQDHDTAAKCLNLPRRPDRNPGEGRKTAEV